jgi:hypothetical protein
MLASEHTLKHSGRGKNGPNNTKHGTSCQGEASLNLGLAPLLPRLTVQTIVRKGWSNSPSSVRHMAVLFIEAAQETMRQDVEGDIERPWTRLVGVERCRRGCHGKANEVGKISFSFPL